MKKLKQTIFLMVAILCMIAPTTIFAAPTHKTDLSNSTNSVEQEEYVGNIKDMIVIDTNPLLPKASISFGGAISSGSYLRSGSSYYMKKGESYDYNVTWAPTGQKIKVGRIHIDTGEVYLTSSKSGGSASGSVSSPSVPAGEYKFVVYNAGTKKITSCTCSISF